VEVVCEVALIVEEELEEVVELFEVDELLEVAVD
jgi:hypothetical protein